MYETAIVCVINKFPLILVGPVTVVNFLSYAGGSVCEVNCDKTTLVK